MPTTKSHAEQQEEALLRAWTEFDRGFRRSCKGNLWRTYDGLTLTVFRRTNGRFAWCMAETEDKRSYSPTSFDCEEDALYDLGYQFFVF